MTKNTLVDQRFFYFSHLRVDPSDADHVYGVSEELSESKDGGATFKPIARGRARRLPRHVDRAERPARA